jgi:hypothetical protein
MFLFILELITIKIKKYKHKDYKYHKKYLYFQVSV